jgi:2,3-bisphosphoglycerate-independent phosphoglycerate mutase
MKYALIIPDGAADEPLEELGGRTPLQAAQIPNMHWIARNGRCGTVRNVPRDMEPGSDVATLSLLGYDPRQYYTGRAPLEAAARGLEIAPDEWVFRCNLVTVIDGLMEDHSAGHISTEEGSALIGELNRLLAGERLRFHPGVSYRHLMTLHGEIDVTATPPHDILGKPIAQHLPTGPGSDMLTILMGRSQEIFSRHEVNQVRRDLGENPATQIWLWGQGKKPSLPKFEERFGVRGAAISAVDLIRGLARLVGWDVVNVPGATGFLDTNYAGKAAAAIEALKDHDLVCVHVEGVDEAGHQGDFKGKILGLEQIDRHIVGPLLEHLRGGSEEWRILVLPDHPTPCRLRTHTAEPVPFALAGSGITSVLKLEFTEASAASSDLHIAIGAELMEYFLKGR